MGQTGKTVRALVGGSLLAALALVVWADRQAEAVAVEMAPAPVCEQASYRDRVRCGRGVSDDRMARERTMTVLAHDLDERPLPADSADAHRLAAHAAACRAANRVLACLKAKEKRGHVASLKARQRVERKERVETYGEWLPVECEHYRPRLGRGLTWEQVDRLERRCVAELRHKRRNK